MKPMKLLYLFALIFCLSSVNYAQRPFQLPEGLGIHNQMKYSFDLDKKREIFENWFRIDYRQGIFSAGIRLDVFQPNDPNPAVSRGKDRFADIGFKYFSVDLHEDDYSVEFTAGNYYALIGKGMILKSYEDRNLRIDNNLIGAKIAARYGDLKILALTGMPENADQTRTDILHAADLEYTVRISGSDYIRAGASYASNLPDPSTGASTTEMMGFRIQPSVWNFDFYGEAAFKKDQDIKDFAFTPDDNFVGAGYYGSATLFLGGFTGLFEYKYYDNIQFNSLDQTVIYNTPPATRKDYSYALLSRHPSPLYQANEKGFLTELSYLFSETGTATVCYSETKSLKGGSYIQTVQGTNLPERIQYREVYGIVEEHLAEPWLMRFAAGYNEELTTDTKNITLVLDNHYNLDEVNSMRCIIEHQNTTDRFSGEQYYTDAVSLEYLRSPGYSFALVTEMRTSEPQIGRTIRNFWTYVQAGYRLGEHTDISLLVGSRQAGAICIGGVCRYEPEFEGVELKMVTRL